MITSTSNAQIKELAKLQKKSRLRDERRIFLVEGPRMVEEIPKERIERLYISESFERKNPAYIRELGMPAEVLSDPVFSYVSDTKNPQGILAVVKRLEYTMEDVLGKSALKCEEKSGEKEKNPENHQIRVPHVIVLDNLQDPGNLGTIFRTAEAAGATGILLSSDSVDVYNPKVIRSTMGAVFRMPFFYVKDLPAAVKSLSSQGIRTYALYYSKNANELRDIFIDELLGCTAPLSAGGQRDSFNALVEDTLGDDCRYDTVLSIHEKLNDLIESQKDEPEPVVLTKSEVKRLFEECGVEDEKLQSFDEQYEITAGEKSSLVASNITNTKRFEIKTPDVVVHVDPERADLVETRIIDGRKCLVIPMEGEVELNGIRVHTGNENPSDDEFYDNTDTETEETSDGE